MQRVTQLHPLRQTLADELRARISAGEWQPGDRLPSEPRLARERGVSRDSIRAAITMLEEGGYVVRRRGSGTYVRERRLDRRASSQTHPGLVRYGSTSPRRIA